MKPAGRTGILLRCCSVSPYTSIVDPFSPWLCQHMRLASWEKRKGVVREEGEGAGRGWSCETGVRPSFEWNSLQGSEFRRSKVALWLAEERWNENHGKLLTPAQQHCRNAQALLWRGGTEPALFLCLLHQSNRDGGENRRKRKGEGERERHKQEGERENYHSASTVKTLTEHNSFVSELQSKKCFISGWQVI